MAIAAIPSNYQIQQGNADVFLTWDLVAGATSYSVQRSADGVTFSGLATPSTNYYLDSTVTVGTNYYYQVASVNSDGTSSYTNPLSIVPTNTADLSLGMVRLMAQERIDRVNSEFVTMPEWNRYINQAYFELYDLLVDVYEDYFVQEPLVVTTDGTGNIALPSDFYKLLGVDFGAGGTGYITVKKFEFIARNRYVYPQITTSALGVFNLRYRLMGSNLMLIPTPQGGQSARIWYIPKLTQLLQDTDILKGVSGWSEYVIVDAGIRALQKEESDVSVLMAQKMALIKRIEESSMNRDAGQPDAISDLKTNAERWGGGLGFDGSFGGI